MDNNKTVFVDKLNMNVNTPLRNPKYIKYSSAIEVLKESRDNYYALSKLPVPKSKEVVNGVLNQLGRGSVAGISSVGSAAYRAVDHASDVSIGWLRKKVKQADPETTQGEAWYAQREFEQSKNAWRAESMEKAKEFDSWLEDSGFEKTDRDRIAYDLGSGAGTMAGAIGASVLTGSPHSAALLFGLGSGREGYEEAIKAGKSPETALAIGTTLGVAEGALEYVGIKMFERMAKGLPLTKSLTRKAIQEASEQGLDVKGISKAIRKSSPIKSFAGSALSEGAQEASQETASILIKDATGLEKSDFATLIQSALVAGAMGAALGGGAGMVFGAINKKFDDAGVEKEVSEALSKILVDKSMSPEYAKAASNMINEEKAYVASPKNDVKLKQKQFKEAYDNSGEVNQQFFNIKEDRKTYIMKQGFSEKEATRLAEMEQIRAVNLFNGSGITPKEFVARNAVLAQRQDAYMASKGKEVVKGGYSGREYYKTTVSPSVLETKRGYVDFNGDRAIINVLKKSNQSTLWHEMGHVFLNDQQIIGGKIYKEALQWLGSKNGELTRDMHEQFADSFVLYLKEGVAPNEALRSMFDMFKDWLRGVYNGALVSGAKLSPEARKTFNDIFKGEKVEEGQVAISPEGKVYFQEEDYVAEAIKEEEKARKEAEEEERSELDKEMTDVDALTKKAKAAIKKKSKGKEASMLTKKWALNIGTHKSMLNLVFGKKLSEEMSTAPQQINEMVGVYKGFKKSGDLLMDAYGLTSEHQISAKVSELSEKQDNYTLEHAGDVIKYSQMDLISIYAQMKNARQNEAYKQFFGKDADGNYNVDVLLSNLSNEDIKFGNSLIPFYASYYPKLNKVYKRVKGQDLGKPENYTPVKTLMMEDADIFDTYDRKMKDPTATKRRSEVAGRPEPVNAYLAMVNYVTQAEHWTNTAEKLNAQEEMIKGLKHQIQNTYGEAIYKNLLHKIEQSGMTGIKAREAANNKGFSGILNNWVAAKVAMNPAVTAKQLISIVNYANEIPVMDFVSGTAEALSHPKKTWKYMFENSPRLEARLKRGGEDVMQRLLNDIPSVKAKGRTFLEKMGVNPTAVKSGLTANIRYADIAPQVYGGYAFVKAKMKEGMSEKEAFKAFDAVSERTQQTGIASLRADIQNNAGAAQRTFTAFKSGIMSALDKMGEATVQFNRGEISGTQYSKTMAIFGAIVPAMYGAMGYFFSTAIYNLIKGEEDEEEYALGKSMLKNIIMTPFNGMAYVSIGANMLEQTVEYGRPFSANIPIFSEFRKGIDGAIKNDPEMLPLFASIIEPMTGVPIQTFLRIADKAGDDKKKNKGL